MNIKCKISITARQSFLLAWCPSIMKIKCKTSRSIRKQTGVPSCLIGASCLQSWFRPREYLVQTRISENLWFQNCPCSIFYYYFLLPFLVLDFHTFYLYCY